MKTWQKLLVAGALGVIAAAILVGIRRDKWIREHLDDFLREKGVI